MFACIVLFVYQYFSHATCQSEASTYDTYEKCWSANLQCGAAENFRGAISIVVHVLVFGWESSCQILSRLAAISAESSSRRYQFWGDDRVASKALLCLLGDMCQVQCLCYRKWGWLTSPPTINIGTKTIYGSRPFPILWVQNTKII